jgi:hypothetical protein
LGGRGDGLLGAARLSQTTDKMPSVNAAMERSLREGAVDLLAASLRPLLDRRAGSITNSATDVKTAFSSWDNCMNFTYCKYVWSLSLLPPGQSAAGERTLTIPNHQTDGRRSRSLSLAASSSSRWCGAWCGACAVASRAVARVSPASSAAATAAAAAIPPKARLTNIWMTHITNRTRAIAPRSP